jgi:hypothetical protein
MTMIGWMTRRAVGSMLPRNSRPRRPQVTRANFDPDDYTRGLLALDKTPERLERMLEELRRGNKVKDMDRILSAMRHVDVVLRGYGHTSNLEGITGGKIMAAMAESHNPEFRERARLAGFIAG